MNKQTEIKINRPLATQLLALAQQSPDTEIHGLVGAIDNTPTTVYPVPNLTGNKQQHRALQTLHENGEILFAVYRSRPHSPPAPPANRLSDSAYPDAYHLIISLNTKGVLEMRAYKLNEKGAQEVTLTV